MSERIRYRNSPSEHVLISTQVFAVGEERYQVHLNTKDFTGVVVNLKNIEAKENVFKTGGHTNLHDLKKSIKAGLEKLGVIFSKGNRNRHGQATEHPDRTQQLKEIYNRQQASGVFNDE